MTPRKVNILTVVLAGLFGALLLGAMQAGSRGGGLIWAKNLTEATALAKRTGQPILVSFHMPECSSCARMDAETFASPQVIEAAKNFVCVRVDSDVDPQAVNAASISEFPTTVFLTNQGREIVRLPGYIAPDRFAALIKSLKI